MAETDEIISMIKTTFRQIIWDGGARCRICGMWVEGDSFGEVLEKLGQHSEEGCEMKGTENG